MAREADCDGEVATRMVRTWVLGAGDFPTVTATEEERAAGQVEFGPLLSVRPALTKLARALLRIPDLEVGPALIDPEKEAVQPLWTALVESAPGEPLLVHFTGHGEKYKGDLYLAVKGSRRNKSTLRKTSLSMTQLLGDVEGSESVGDVLFLLDVCGAGQAVAAQMAQGIAEQDRKAWVIAACAADQSAFRSRFTLAAATVFERLAKGWLDVSPALTHVPLETLAAEIDLELIRTCAAEESAYAQTVIRTPHLAASAPPPPFFRNRAYSDHPSGRYRSRVESALWQFAAEASLGLDPVHFVTRASGSSPGWANSGQCLFYGRKEERATINRWLENNDDDEPPLLVVTGIAGSGKSALLGITACLTHRQLAPVADAVHSRIDVGERPRPNARVLAVHARQLSAFDVIRSLLSQLGNLDTDLDSRRFSGLAKGHSLRPEKLLGDARSHDEAWRELTEQLRLAGPTVVIVDALDEANDPLALLRNVLLPLAERESGPAPPECRVVIGTRRGVESTDALDTAVARTGRLLDLDKVPAEQLTDDLKGYLRALLWTDGRYSESAAGAIAANLSRSTEHGGFLLAALYADHLRNLATTLTGSEAAGQVPCTLSGMFDLHLTTLADEMPWVRPVLAALGHARGQGMPASLLHALALALDRGRYANPQGAEPDVQATLDALATAGFYLRAATDTDGRRLYRYFHESLAEHTARLAKPREVFDALLSTVTPRTADAGPVWHLALPYLLRHLAEHAVAANALDELLTDPGFLVLADPERLAPLLDRARSLQAVQCAEIYRPTAHHPMRHILEARRSLLALQATAWRNPSLAQAWASLRIDHRPLPALPIWTTHQRSETLRRHHTMTDQGPWVISVSTVTLDGRPTAVVAADDGSITVWSLDSGRRIHHLVDPGSWALGVATIDGAGRSLALSGGKGGTATVWDLATGQLVGTPTSHSPDVKAVSTLALDGRLLGVTAGRGGTAVVWDLRTCTRLHVLAGHGSAVVEIAAFAMEDQALGVTTSADGTVTVWDLCTGHLIRAFKDNGAAAISSTITSVEGRSCVVAGGREYSAVVWDLASGRRLHTLVGHRGSVNAVVTTTLDGRPSAVTAGADGTAIVWDLSSGQSVHTLVGHRGSVNAVVTTTLDGRPSAVTAGADGTAIVWDLTTFERVHTLVGPGGTVSALDTGVVDGVPYALTGGRGGTAVAWNLVTGQRTHTFSGQAGSRSAAVISDDGRLIFTCGRGGAPTAHELDTGRHVRTFVERGTSINALASVSVDGEHWLVATSNDGTVTAWDPNSRFDPVDYTSSASQHDPDRDSRILIRHTDAMNGVAAALLHNRPIAVTGARDGAVALWSLSNGERLATFPGHKDAVHSVIIAVVGSRSLAVTAGRDARVLVWDLARGRQVAEFVGHRDAVNVMEHFILGDRSLIITGGVDGTTFVWNPATGQRVEALKGHTGSVNAVATLVKDNQTLIVTAGDDGTARVWDLASGVCVHRLAHEGRAVNAVAAAVVDGRTLIATGVGESAMIWDLSGETAQSHTLAFPSTCTRLAATNRYLVVSHGFDVTRLSWQAAPHQA
ncbi:WD40 repeat domain-containing protein [Streptomyces sp. NBC_01167]|uniref:AAA family ATPase n=1 Tax=Streptomyces sp. NBC_01167 TaxID=2903756 RepID=UPI0038661532|nr:WD40 repeat domain-containing protein [Streptomyces sp. NBC_01167]